VAECEPGADGQIQSQSSDDICLAPVRFEWEDGDPEFVTIDTGISGVLDASTKAEFGHGGLTVADLNGDGMSDIVYAVIENGLRKHKFARSAAGGAPSDQLADFVSGSRPAFGTAGIIGSSNSYQDRFRFANPWFLDVDGDGQAELFLPWFIRTETNTISAQELGVEREFTFNKYSTNLGFFGGSGFELFGPIHAETYLSNLIVLPIDWLGDGLSDVAVLREDGRLAPPYSSAWSNWNNPPDRQCYWNREPGTWEGVRCSTVPPPDHDSFDSFVCQIRHQDPNHQDECDEDPYSEEFCPTQGWTKDSCYWSFTMDIISNEPGNLLGSLIENLPFGSDPRDWSSLYAHAEPRVRVRGRDHGPDDQDGRWLWRGLWRRHRSGRAPGHGVARPDLRVRGRESRADLHEHAAADGSPRRRRRLRGCGRRGPAGDPRGPRRCSRGGRRLIGLCRR
jgi:hypothetical protein